MHPTTTEVLAAANDALAAHTSLLTRVREVQLNHRRVLGLSPEDFPVIPIPHHTPDADPEEPEHQRPLPPQRDLSLLPPAKRARATRYQNYVPEEETIRNDYSQRYVDGGERPQNWVLGAELEKRFEEYPKQQRLLALKKAAVSSNSLPPTYLPFSALSSLNPCKFDSILLDPPFSSSFSWDDLAALPIPSLAADPSFIFLWVGSSAGSGLERGREIMAKWGYRRCEDVVWVKTNKASNNGPGSDPPTTSLFTRTKQHCLIGIRGTVRRSTDSWFVHCNIDTDVLIWEGDPSDPMRKPEEMYALVENFCLGTRRLEIFGRSTTLRRGWVTVLDQDQLERLQAHSPGNPSIHIPGEDGGTASPFHRETWENGIKELAAGGKSVVPMNTEVESLRPKSPFRASNANSSNHSNASGLVPGVAQSHGMMQMGGVNTAMPPRFGNPMAQPTPMHGMGMSMSMPMGMGMNMAGMDSGQWPAMANMGIPMHGHTNPMAMGGLQMGAGNNMNPYMFMNNPGMPMNMGNMGMGWDGNNMQWSGQGNGTG